MSDSEKRAVCILITRIIGGRLEILAVSRKDDETAFGLPGGKVEPGEDPYVAARRELKEETGVDATVFEPVFTRPRQGEDEYVSTTFRVKNYYGLPGRRKGEGVVKWVTPDVLVSGPFGEYNSELFKALMIEQGH